MNTPQNNNPGQGSSEFNTQSHLEPAVDTGENAYEEREFDRSEEETIPPNHIEDEEVGENKDGETFLEWVSRLNKSGHKISGEEFARELMLWFQSGADFDEEAKKIEEEKFARWLESSTHKYRSLPQMLKDTKLPLTKYLLTGTVSGGYERMTAQLIRKAVSEIDDANLTAGDRKNCFMKSCQNRQELEAKSFLMALAGSADINNWMFEYYYKHFGQKREVPVFNRDGTPVYNEDGKRKTLVEYMGSSRDIWFETLVVREAGKKGNRPDYWTNGRRANVVDPDSGEKIQVIRSAEWQAWNTDDDIQQSGGRRNNVNKSTHDSNYVESEAECDAIKELLIRKQDEWKNGGEAKMRHQLQILENKAQHLEGMDERQKKAVETEIRHQKKRVHDEEQRILAINDRLDHGFEVGDIRSFLLDPTDYETKSTIQKIGPDGKPIKGEFFSEADLAVELTVRKYWQARSDKDCQILVENQHVKVYERQIMLKLMDDKYRGEFQWSSQHHILGVRQDSEYDPARDGPRQIVKYLDDRDKEDSASNFSVNARRFRFASRGKRKDDPAPRDIIIYDKKDHAKVMRPSHELYPKDEKAVFDFFVSKIPPEVLDALPDETDPNYLFGQSSESEIHTDGADKDEFMVALEGGLATAKEYLAKSNIDVTRGISEYRPKLDKYKSMVSQNFNFNQIGLDDSEIESVLFAVQQAVNQLEPDQKVKIEAVRANLPPENIKGDYEKLIDEIHKQLINKFNPEIISKMWQAYETLRLLAEDREIEEVIGQKKENESNGEYRRRLEYNINNIDKVFSALTPEDKINVIDPPTEDQKKLIERIWPMVEIGDKSIGDIYLELGELKVNQQLASSKLRAQETTPEA